MERLVIVEVNGKNPRLVKGKVLDNGKTIVKESLLYDISNELGLHPNANKVMGGTIYK